MSEANYYLVKVNDPVTGRVITCGCGDNDEALTPEIYRDRDFKTPLQLVIDKPNGYTYQQGLSCVYETINGRGQTETFPTVAVWMIYEIASRMTFIPKQDIQCGGLTTWKADIPVTIKSLVEVTCIDHGDYPSQPIIEDIEKYQYGFLFLLLLPSRTMKTVMNLNTYMNRLLEACETVVQTPPFNLQSSMIAGVKQNTMAFLNYRTYPSVRMLAAVVDYMLKCNPTSMYASMRMATLSTHNSDHAMVNLINQISKTQKEVPVKFPHLLVMPEAAHEFCVICANYTELYSRGSLQPYTRSMNLVIKSSYSATQNPHLYSILAVYLGLSNNPLFFNINKPPYFVDAEFVCGYFMHLYYGGARKLGIYVTAHDSESVDTETTTLVETVPTTPLEASEWMIHKMKECNSSFTSEALIYVKTKLPTPVREGTIGDYLSKLIPPVNPQLGLMKIDIPNLGNTSPDEEDVFATIPTN